MPAHQVYMFKQPALLHSKQTLKETERNSQLPAYNGVETALHNAVIAFWDTSRRCVLS